MLRILYPKNFYREIEDLGDGKFRKHMVVAQSCGCDNATELHT